MVKHLKLFGHSIKWTVLLAVMAILGLGLWLHGGERSLNFAKPWLTRTLNTPDAPYSIAIGAVTVNWTNVAELGKLHFKDVSFAKRDGNVFAQFPDATATIDPIGFMPDRRLLHEVTLNEPRFFAVRTAGGNIEFGIENSDTRLALADVLAFFYGSSGESEGAHGDAGHGKQLHEDVGHTEPAHEQADHSATIAPADTPPAEDPHAGTVTEPAHEENAHANPAQETPEEPKKAAHEPATHQETPHETPAHEEIPHAGPIHEKDAHAQAAHGEADHDQAAHDEPAHGQAAQTDAADHAVPPDTREPFSLPFEKLLITRAHFTFTDERSGTKFTSDALELELKKNEGAFDASLSLPFTVDDEPVLIRAGLLDQPLSQNHALTVNFTDVPSRLICLFADCPEEIILKGTLDGDVKIAVKDADFSAHAFSGTLATDAATIDAPEWFAQPLKLGKSSLSLVGDFHAQQVAIEEMQLALEDTTISGKASLRKGGDGFYVTADAACSTLDVRKLAKYWPLTMAPDSRIWVTSKIKSGYAASGTLKLNLTPADFAAEYFPEKSVYAKVDARDITFEYLPGFPMVEKMNGIAQFSATTLKVDGKGGSLMGGTTSINRAELWCPKLMSDTNPMEATLDISAPAGDAVKMLALEHFPFDDAFGLDAATIKGSANAVMKLKFNAFSNHPGGDDGKIHLDAVDYDIATTLKDAAQKNVYGAYDVHRLNGTLKADNKGIAFEGVADVGSAGLNELKMSQIYGRALKLAVKGRAGAEPKPLNDFALSYESALVPVIELSGARFDGSVSYGNSTQSPFSDFPAMDMKVDLAELLLTPDAPFTEVKGKILCSKNRCESADIEAKAGKALVRAAIHQITGKRQFVMSSSDAGALLKALGVTERMSKGRFDLKGDYDDSKTPPHLDARLHIVDFTLQNSKILERIISIGSLSGLKNALTGSGITFDKMSANLGVQAGVVSVGKGVARGGSMGLTFDGQVDTNAASLNLKGVVAPAYALNSILGKIPLIGALAGGEEGLIAFNYSVKGPYADPEVNVNALSGLTPGFLRSVFAGGSKVDGGEKEGEQAPKKNKTQGH